MDSLHKEQLASWLDTPSNLPLEAVEVLESIVDEYPYFQLGYTLLFSAKITHTSSTVHDLSRAALYGLDRAVYKQLVEGEDPWERLATNEIGAPKSSASVSWENNTQETVWSEEKQPINSEEIVTTPLQDSFLDVESIDARQYQKDLVERFIQNNPKIRPVKDLLGEGNELLDLSNSADKTIDSATPATESFAKILEKQGKFSKSVEIYEKLILKNPEKKDYFAEKIRELSLKNRE